MFSASCLFEPHLTPAGSPRRGANAQSRMAGLPAKRFKSTSPLKVPNRCIPVGSRWLWTQLATSHSLAASMVLLAYTRYPNSRLSKP